MFRPTSIHKIDIRGRILVLIALLVSFSYSEFVKRILNISSFLTLPHFLDCHISTRNSVSIDFLLWMMGAWYRCRRGGVGRFISRCGDRGWVLSHSFFFFFLTCPFVFCCLMSCLFFKSVECDGCCVCCVL